MLDTHPYVELETNLIPAETQPQVNEPTILSQIQLETKDCHPSFNENGQTFLS